MRLFLYSGFEKIKAAVSFALKSNDALTLADHGGFWRESLWYENAIDIICQEITCQKKSTYTKNPPRTPPQWEESSTVFAYRVRCGRRLLLSSAKNNSTFFCAFINCCISSRALR